MTPEEFLVILKSVNAMASPQWLDIEIHETGLDSLDLMMLRSSLETAIHDAIPDKLWFESETLRQLLKGLV